MTASEVVSLAFTRNVSELHFKASDILLAQAQYVDAYISGFTEVSTFFTTYCKPVIAYGTVVLCFERVASEITDRGVVDMVTNGATRIDPTNKLALKNEYATVLNSLIELMVTKAESESGVTIIDDTLAYSLIQFSGTEAVGSL
jgi:hypothetical protein